MYAPEETVDGFDALIAFLGLESKEKKEDEYDYKNCVDKHGTDSDIEHGNFGLVGHHLGVHHEICDSLNETCKKVVLILLGCEVKLCKDYNGCKLKTSYDEKYQINLRMYGLLP